MTNYNIAICSSHCQPQRKEDYENMNQLTLKGYVHNVTKTSLTRSGATNYNYTLFFLFTIAAFRSTLFKKTFPILTNYNITICSSHCQPERKEDYENMNQLTLKGYAHNVTKTSLSRSGATNYFNFSLQVNESRKRRAVCYDASKQPLLEGYKTAHHPPQHHRKAKSSRSCGAACYSQQKIPHRATKQRPVHIAVRDSKHDLVWLKVFTPVLQEMFMQPSTDVTINSTEDNNYLRTITHAAKPNHPLQ